ncbi:TatD DNase family protein [Paraglaciecola mesophila KMM 241]|uniref:TatD DNase family protein n=1 Tax=Paraglaciecola mesophila KMM 241 TaxID=1128912 RepID=K6Z7M1_9ALTE|nr:TatD family hydrolase [Paraglaciecola mesophila]GAC24978.1 TatD DNase family protein [Paraglaciecola mesophila KMM 241]
MIDSHCHLDFPAFDLDRDQVLLKCAQLGVNSIVIPGTQASMWPRQILLCESYSQLKFALGLHPYFLHNYRTEQLQLLDQQLSLHQGKVVAVGEIGLDFSLPTDEVLQERVFSEQLDLAHQHRLPVIVHHRQSHNALIRLLKKSTFCNGGIIHAFSGSLQEARAYIDLGFKLGIGGTITYPRAKKTRAVIAQVPLSSLVLETDAPDMPINSKQGERNSPSYLPLILDALQALRTEPENDVKQACWQNTLNILPNISN